MTMGFIVFGFRGREGWSSDLRKRIQRGGSVVELDSGGL